MSRRYTRRGGSRPAALANPADLTNGKWICANQLDLFATEPATGEEHPVLTSGNTE